MCHASWFPCHRRRPECACAYRFPCDAVSYYATAPAVVCMFWEWRFIYFQFPRRRTLGVEARPSAIDLRGSGIAPPPAVRAPRRCRHNSGTGQVSLYPHVPEVSYIDAKLKEHDAVADMQAVKNVRPQFEQQGRSPRGVLLKQQVKPSSFFVF